MRISDYRIYSINETNAYKKKAFAPNRLEATVIVKARSGESDCHFQRDL